MKLSNIELKHSTVLRDGYYERIGFPGHPSQNKIVVSLSNKNIDKINSDMNISSVLVKDNYDDLDERFGILKTNDFKSSLLELHEKTNKAIFNNNHETIIEKGTKIHDSVKIPQHGVVIGKKCTIGPNVIIYPGTTIGDKTVIDSGSVIGNNSMFAIKIGDDFVLFSQQGGVRIGCGVELHSNTTVDRGTFNDYTTIDDEVKINNLAMICSGSHIGKRSFILAGACLGNYSTIGAESWVGPNSTIDDFLKLGNNVKISLGSVVVEDLDDNSAVSGNFAISHDRFIKVMKIIR